jgi:hypothetical protein
VVVVVVCWAAVLGRRAAYYCRDEVEVDAVGRSWCPRGTGRRLVVEVLERCCSWARFGWRGCEVVALVGEISRVYYDGIFIVAIVQSCGQETDVFFINGGGAAGMVLVAMVGCCSAIGSGLGHAWLLSASCAGELWE